MVQSRRAFDLHTREMRLRLHNQGLCKESPVPVHPAMTTTRPSQLLDHIAPEADMCES